MNRLRNTAQRPRSDALTNSAPDAANGSPFESSLPNPLTVENQTSPKLQAPLLGQQDATVTSEGEVAAVSRATTDKKQE